MTLDSETCRQFASLIKSLKGSVWLETPALKSRHTQILAGLDAMAGMFESMATLAVQTESTLLNSMPWTGTAAAGFTCSGSVTGSAAKLLSSGTIKATGKASYVLGESTASWSSDLASAAATIRALEVSANGTASLKAVSGKSISPTLTLNGTLSAAIANTAVTASISRSSITASATGKAETGTVYVKAKAVVNNTGIDADFSVGLAAVRGECVLAVDISGLKLSLTLTGIVGGMEISASYKQTTSSWETGIGAAIGIGGSMKFGIDW